MPTQLDIRQSVLRSALGFVGSAAGDTVDTILAKIDPELSKLFEDRNIFLTDGGLITFTGTQLQFTENLNLVINQKVAGGVPVVISLGSANVNFTTNLDMWYAVINRTGGTATTTVVANATGLPAVVAANQEVFLIAKRIDAGDGTQRIYWRNGMALNAGQTVRLGASGSGTGGSGVGDDLDALTFRASFNDGFDDGPSSALSAVDVTAAKTDSTAYNAAKAMYTLNYDASKTIAAGTTTTNINISAVAAFTVKTGDMVINNGQARKITAVATQASFTTEAFSVAPTLASQVTVSQAVHTKDIYNLALDGNALSAAFPASTFSEIMIDYEDTSAAGDNIFDIDTVPVIAYTASGDGTNYTAVKVRPTNETDTVQSVTLPAAGSDLFLRFFANKTSTSGTLNILRYKAFMQKAVTATGGGVINAAYGFLNGTGTEYQSTLSVVGGKSTITLTNWTYAVGVSSGSPYGSIDVYVNGQLLPRFLDSTTTPDGSYLETSPSVITLDKDYSAQALSYEILQRVQIVDNSTVNTSNLSVLKEITAQSLVDFVNMSNTMTPTTTTGTPVAGTFYSTVVGRASMPDLSQDLKVRLGINRVEIQQIYKIASEQGPNGEQVSGSVNDLFGEIRLVGNWTFNIGASDGPHPFTSVANDYAEITWYGTGLNVLLLDDNTSRTLVTSIDGGADSANFYISGSTNSPSSRGYRTNQMINVATRLTAGVHTARIKFTAGTNFRLFGFEMLNETTTLSINPGSSYQDGSKLVLSSAQTPAFASSFESGTLGSRGGRVLVYQKADGTIGKAVTPTGSQANTSSADHTNEEIARDISWREFGAGRADDFSTVTGTSSSRAFTLDDDTTTLMSATASQSGSTLADAFNIATSSGNLFIFHFIGTGLDIVNARGATLDTNYTISVDGTAIATNVSGATLFGAGQFNIAKIVSGLSYGSHTVRVSCSTTGTVGVGITKFIVYQPKTPSLPSGAVALAAYNLLPTFTANATTGQDTISTGVMRKLSAREFIYSGTWGAFALNQANIGGIVISSTTNADFFQYTFFGTGFDFRFAGNGTAATLQMTLDGVTNLTVSNGVFWTGALTTTSYQGAGGTFTASTATISTPTSATVGNGVTVNGLNLGIHTIKITKTGGTGTFVPEALDIVSNVHAYKEMSPASLQDASIVGSQTIGDKRKFSALVDPLTNQKAWAQAVGITNSPTTTSGVLVPLAEMSVTVKTNGGPLDIFYSLSFQCNVANSPMILVAAFVDGVQIETSNEVGNTTTNMIFPISNRLIWPVAAGVHKVDLFWASPVAGTTTVTALGTIRTLNVREI